MKYMENEDKVTFGQLSRNFYYASLLVDGIMEENLPKVTHLLESKEANPNTVVPELGVAPLHMLAGLENEDFTCRIAHQAIIRNGGNPNVRSEEGLTPVHVAAMWGRCKVLEILLANGGDPELIDDVLFLTAEEYAIKEHQWEAYGVLCTFPIMTNEYKTDMYLEEESKGKVISNKFSNKTQNDKGMRKLKEEASIYSENSDSYGRNSCRYASVMKGKKNNEPDKYYYDVRSSKSTNKSVNSHEDVRYSMEKQPKMRRSHKYHRKNHLDDLHFDKIDTSQTLILKKDALNAINALSRQSKSNHIYESLEDNPLQVSAKNKFTDQLTNDNYNKHSFYGDSVSESCDWIRKKGNFELDDNALNTIKNQRLCTKIYQANGLGKDLSKKQDKKPPLYEESETCDWVNPKHPVTFNKSSLKIMKNHRARSEAYTSEESQGTKSLCTGPKLPRRNSKPQYLKNNDSDVYLYSYAEESVRTNNHQIQTRYLPSGLSDMTCSDIDQRGFPNQKLCKMSRMFLFMLKKRHVYQKIKKA